ncbi:Transcriptional regulator MraZ [Bienertia sinuspersici]
MVHGDESGSTSDPLASRNLPVDGAEWVEHFVREMSAASDVEDARLRASRALEAFEKSVYAHAKAETAQNLQQENSTLKEQLQLLLQENGILKRAVSIQHERQKEFEAKSQEVQQLKQLLSQCQEHIRTLEVNNYALAMHLKQAEQNNSIPGRFNPDIF